MSKARTSPDVLAGVALIALSVAYFAGASGLPDGLDGPGPRFFPILLSGLLFGLAITIVVRGSHDTETRDSRLPYGLIAMTALYALAFTYAGFIASTLVYTLGVTVLLGQRGWRAAIVPVVTTASIHLLLGLGLGAPLP